MKLRKLFLALLLAGNLSGIIIQLAESENPVQTMLYFTMLSNVVVFGSFLYFLLKKKELSTNDVILKGAVTISILLTFLVYHTLLNPIFGESDYNPPFWGDFFVHTFTPLMVLLDYFLFDKKGNFRYSFIPFWLIFPMFYFLFANIYALFGGMFVYEDSSSRYPYFFMDPDKIGWGMVWVFVLAILIFLSLLSALIVFVDKRIVLEEKRKRS